MNCPDLMLFPAIAFPFPGKNRDKKTPDPLNISQGERDWLQVSIREFLQEVERAIASLGEPCGVQSKSPIQPFIRSNFNRSVR